MHFRSQYCTQALVSEGANVTVITRRSKAEVKNLRAGINVISNELTHVATLAAVFSENDIQVVVSTVSDTAIPVSRPCMTHTSATASLTLCE